MNATYTLPVTKRHSELHTITEDREGNNNAGAKRHARRNFNRAERNATKRALRDLTLMGWEDE